MRAAVRGRSRLPARRLRVAVSLLLATCAGSVSLAGEVAFPDDFVQPDQVIGGAGGSACRERERLRRLPTIMISDNGRVHGDWLGANCGSSSGSVYEAFRNHGFDPFELWMLDLVQEEGEQLASLELRTDNLKEMIFAVLRYTGAPQVNLLAHGAGAVVAQAALVKYNLFYAVHSAAYIAGPFHGTYECSSEACMEGFPICCALTPGSSFLRDVLVPDETPHGPSSEADGGIWTTRYLTVRNGLRFGDSWFRRNPESPALLGARNLSFPSHDHDGLRCAPEVLELVIPFLGVAARPYRADRDGDGDGFLGVEDGGPDCDDHDPLVHPGAPETCGDGVDQDCNRVDISCKGGKDRDLPPSLTPRISTIPDRGPPPRGRRRP